MFCEHIDETTKQVFGLTSKAFAGYVQVGEVEQAYNGIWYLKGHAPQAPEPTYIELRQAAYPQVGDQLDMIYWDQVNGTDIWRQTIAAIKAEYPKPVENQTGETAAANDGTDETVSSVTDASEQDIPSWTGV